MKVDSFYNDFDGWLNSSKAPQAALISRAHTNLTIEYRHEYWLIAIGLDETSWFIYCSRYNTEVVLLTKND